jgi:hypothetical protein
LGLTDVRDQSGDKRVLVESLERHGRPLLMSVIIR